MRPDNVQGFILSRVLELMGLTQHRRIGPYRIFVNQQGRLALTFEERWDMAIEDVEALLRKNGLSVDLFWEKHESLYHRT